MNLKKLSPFGGGLVGLVYGVLAVCTAYPDAPWNLQLFIAVGVTLVGASAGYIIGCFIGDGETAAPARRER